jgi:HTH-type transcriptional regulator/antitoxin HigA
MATRTKRSPAARPADTYMKLIRRLPLKPIKNDQQHQAAVDVISGLFGHDLDDGASAYLDTLILLVNQYEDVHHTPGGTELTPQAALRAIMATNSLTQAQIGKIIGSETAVSMFLKGDRGLSKAHIKALVERFGIDAAVFL